MEEKECDVGIRKLKTVMDWSVGVRIDLWNLVRFGSWVGSRFCIKWNSTDANVVSVRDEDEERESAYVWGERESAYVEGERG